MYPQQSPQSHARHNADVLYNSPPLSTPPHRHSHNTLPAQHERTHTYALCVVLKKNDYKVTRTRIQKKTVATYPSPARTNTFMCSACVDYMSCTYIISTLCYRVAKTHRMPYLSWSFFRKRARYCLHVTNNQLTQSTCQCMYTHWVPPQCVILSHV